MHCFSYVHTWWPGTHPHWHHVYFSLEVNGAQFSAHDFTASDIYTVCAKFIIHNIVFATSYHVWRWSFFLSRFCFSFPEHYKGLPFPLKHVLPLLGCRSIKLNQKTKKHDSFHFPFHTLKCHRRRVHWPPRRKSHVSCYKDNGNIILLVFLWNIHHVAADVKPQESIIHCAQHA